MLHLITCHGRMMPLLAELLFLLDTTTGDSFSNRPYHGKTCLWTYVDREGPDQPAHPHSLISLYCPITKTCLCNADPLKPHFYVVNLGFTWVYSILLIFAQNHRLLVLVRTASLLEPPR